MVEATSDYVIQMGQQRLFRPAWVRSAYPMIADMTVRIVNCSNVLP